MAILRILSLSRTVVTVALLVATLLAPGVGRAEEPPGVVVSLFVDDFADRWRAGDADGLAQLWHEDGDWMGLLGSRRPSRGRAAVAGVWRVGLDGRDTPDQRAIEVEIDGARRLGPDRFQVDLVMTFGTPATGTIREAMVATVVHTDGAWRIWTARVARISSEPAAAD